MTVLSSPEELIQDARQGKMIILIDDENRENEGDLILPASYVSTESINFMVTHGRGLVCLALSPDICDRLDLPMMVRRNSSRFKTAFTVSIEASKGITTGISAQDRAKTIEVASDPKSGPNDIAMPGHIFPLKAEKEGVLARQGHTEAAVDIAMLAGLSPASVICEIMNKDGSMARLPDLLEFSKQHNINIGTIADLVQYRLEQKEETLVSCHIS